jgi:hypothetical protein
MRWSHQILELVYAAAYQPRLDLAERIQMMRRNRPESAPEAQALF